MLNIKKIFAVLLIATFLISVPLTLACISEEVCSVTFVYKYDDAKGKPPGTPGNGPPDKEDPEDQLGYEFLRKGYEWKDFPIEIVMHTDLGMYQPAIEAAMLEWDSNTGVTLFDYSITPDATANLDDPDYPDTRNELSFGDYPVAGVIAVCRVWFYKFARDRRIVQFDILFDTDFEWGDASFDSELMDVQNIAIHEIGHGLGLADLYGPGLSDHTMYGYAIEGETKKRDLADGDIAGIQALYGS